MNIEQGFQLDVPELHIPWEIDEQRLVMLFKAQEVALNQVTRGYYTLTDCVSLGGLICNLGFHFGAGEGGLLKEFEFFRTSYENLQDSYDEFQHYFRTVFGPPQRSGKFIDGFPYDEWELKRIVIKHFIQDRFGQEEHLKIIRK